MAKKEDGAVTYEGLLKELKKKNYKPVYVFEGDEPYYVDKLSEFIENNVLSPAERGFNLQVLYGNEVKPIDIVNRARQYPMFGQMQVIVVKEAQTIKDWEPIASYVEAPLNSTLLAFCIRNDKLDKRTKAAKVIAQKGSVLTTKKLYDNQVPAWIEKRVKDDGYRISHQAVQLLSEYVGNDLIALDKELTKLYLNLKDGDEVTVEHIEKFIGINKEFNSFELCKALAFRDAAKAHRIAAYLGAHEKANPFVVVMGSLYNYFNRIMLYRQRGDAALIALGVNRFFVDEYAVAARNYPFPKDRDVIFLLNEYDLKSKHILPATSEHGDLLRELVFKILH
jgi:DNA polymerase III subunit delta